MSDTRYARAQARWLAREFPGWDIEPERVVRVEFRYEAGYRYSSCTFGDAAYHIILTYDNGEHLYVYPDTHEDSIIDLTRMVVEGLALLDGEESA